MITEKHIINANGKLSKKGFKGKSSHVVEITVTGRDDLNLLADIVEANGNALRAHHLRGATSFKMTMSPKTAAKMFAEKQS